MSRWLCWVWLALFVCWGTPAGAEPEAAQEKASSAVPLLDDLGTYHHPVTTTSELAQRYFNQGLRLAYAFNHDEAVRSFEEAARLDPTCAMAYWGIALALGPNINLPMDAEREKGAYGAIQKAISLARYASERERDYLEALARRYSVGPDSDRAAKDLAYAEAMRKLARRYPYDLDAATLFAEALMDLRPWEYWTADGQPQPGTLEIVSTLEAVLERLPDHPGAIHYYIHALEASSTPQRALPFARRLGPLVPGAGHLVHMPSHIYFRVGEYAEAAASNERAVMVDERYIEASAPPPKGIYPAMYYPHNIDFLCASLSAEGRSEETIRAARRLAQKAPEEAARRMPDLEVWTAMPLCALTRFGKWEEILHEPRPATDLSYVSAIWHYARALAFLREGRAEDAKREQASLEVIAKEAPRERMLMGRNSAADLLGIASRVVAGELAAGRGDTQDAVRHLEEAVRIQDGLAYTEPPPWYYPVRQSLGAVLLEAGRPAEAEEVYREDLRRNPENGWSLYGLARSLRTRGADKEADKAQRRFEKAWARADVELAASRF